MDKKKQKLKAAISLMSVLPPSQIRQNIIGVLGMVPAIQESILQKVDMPHLLQTDSKTGEKYIRTEMNKHGESHRSPLSNNYYPPIQSHREAYYPSSTLREFEEKANRLFSEYTRLYYEGGVGSFYVKESEDGLVCGYFAKKECSEEYGFVGCWDTFNTIDIKIDVSNTSKTQNSKKAIYKLSTTVLLEVSIQDLQHGDIKLSGQLRKTKEQTHKLTQEKFIDDFHIANIGRMIEDMETNLRQQAESVQLGKLNSIVAGTRYENTKKSEECRINLAAEINKYRVNIQQLQEKECIVLK